MAIKKRHQIWLENFLVNCKLQNKSNHTIKNYRADLIKFLNWYELTHTTLITKVKGDTISEYKDFITKGGMLKKKKGLKDRVKKGMGKLLLFKRKKETKIQKKSTKRMDQDPLAVASRRRHLSTVKNFFEYLKQSHEDRSRLFKMNPVKSKIHAIKLKEVDVLPTKMLTKEDWHKIDETIYRIKERFLVNLLYWGGLRLAEVTFLKLSDFNHSNHTIKVTRKGGYVHTLPIQREKNIFKLLDAYLSTISSETEINYLFCNKRGKPVTERTIYNLLMRIFEKSNCSKGLTPHSFRKACATNLYLKTRDLLYVRDYLNHNDAKVTQTYIDRQIFDKVDKLKKANIKNY